MEEKEYYCSKCSRVTLVQGYKNTPVCCGHNMYLKDQCKSVHPEMARNDRIDDPCDDGSG